MSAVIRGAAENDLPALAALKAEYINSRYQGFARADLLRRACPSLYLPEFEGWLADPLCHVDILQDAGRIESYIVYRREAQEPAGWIVEGRNRSRCDSEKDNRLISSAIVSLRQQDCTVVRVWLLKSNYRMRFLFENNGFRPDGERRMLEKDGQSFEMVRYCCPL